ncbi:MAG: hypothetical protein IPM54_36080 [Polyangiaceae bacterium]|nr:hypothetical protein [Polyangiaceae bacterium]
MARTLIGWALPGVFFTVGFGFSACVGSSDPVGDDCEPSLVSASSSSSGNGGAGGGGTGAGGSGAQSAGDPETSENPDNNFHHPNEPTQSGQADPFEILKQRASEGPPDVRTRLHSCSKLSYTALGEFLVSRGVNMATPGQGGVPSAGELYNAASTKDALGLANYDARMGESYYYTISSATKMFDIFVQAAPQIIANIQNMPECQINGVGNPMFDPVTDKCDYNALSCIMGRPALDEDLTLCNLMISEATPAELENRKKITVAAFLAAAHTCQ